MTASSSGSPQNLSLPTGFRTANHCPPLPTCKRKSVRQVCCISHPWDLGHSTSSRTNQSKCPWLVALRSNDDGQLEGHGQLQRQLLHEAEKSHLTDMKFRPTLKLTDGSSTTRALVLVTFGLSQSGRTIA